MSKLRNKNVANEIKYTKYCITIQMKSSVRLPCVSYLVASLSAEPALFVLNTAEDSHHVIIDIKSSLPFEKILQKGHFYHYHPIPLAPTPTPQTCHM